MNLHSFIPEVLGHSHFHSLKFLLIFYQFSLSKTILDCFPSVFDRVCHQESDVEHEIKNYDVDQDITVNVLQLPYLCGVSLLWLSDEELVVQVRARKDADLVDHLGSIYVLALVHLNVHQVDEVAH